MLSLERLLLSVVGTAYAGVIFLFLGRVEVTEQPLSILELSTVSLVAIGCIWAIVYCLNREEKAKS